jgi:hypothetical protein
MQLKSIALKGEAFPTHWISQRKIQVSRPTPNSIESYGI